MIRNLVEGLTMSDTETIDKPGVTLPMTAKFIDKLNIGVTADEYRIMAGETGPGSTGTGPDQFGNRDTRGDIKDVET
jgi:hypothetical protein